MSTKYILLKQVFEAVLAFTYEGVSESEIDAMVADEIVKILPTMIGDIADFLRRNHHVMGKDIGGATDLWEAFAIAGNEFYMEEFVKLKFLERLYKNAKYSIEVTLVHTSEPNPAIGDIYQTVLSTTPGAFEYNKEYWINTQYSLAELTKDYTDQGREHPADEAYKSLRDEIIDEMSSHVVYLDIKVSALEVLLVNVNIKDYISTFSWHTSKESETIKYLLEQVDLDSYIQLAEDKVRELSELAGDTDE